MKKYIFFVLLIVCALFSPQAQPNISVQKVVFINDQVDRTIDSVGDVELSIQEGFLQVYYYCLYFSIQTDDLSIIDKEQSPFYVRFKSHNDTIPTFFCDSIIQDLDGPAIIWVTAPFEEIYMPYDKEFIIQDIEQACNQMPSAFQETVDLMYYDILDNKYWHIECRNFSAPYYSEEKETYTQLCPFPKFLPDIEKFKPKDLENFVFPEFDLDGESFDEFTMPPY
ncbi:MAG: hypothetical protein MJZ46_05790 [Bacteroidales bacterium]|nr:hypothetical protein [Bacteroidales bacterium]